MNLYPAIDIFKGRVVRLTRGDYNQEIVYSEHPNLKAKEWQDSGAEWIHVVDLEGAKSGEIANFESLKKIREQVRCKIEFGGGLRTFEQIKSVIDLGVDRIILGTKALDFDFFKKVLDQFQDHVAVGLDLKDQMVQTEGWIKASGTTLTEIIGLLNKTLLKTIIYTDISKDGMLQGPNFKGLQDVLAQAKANVILSGGVSKLQDIENCLKLSERNFDGVIIGKALYENRFTLEEAVTLNNKETEV